VNVWGWIRYERTYRQREDGTKLYIGFFRQDHDPHAWTVVRVPFWAHKPIVALRTICQSDKDPGAYAHQTVN